MKKLLTAIALVLSTIAAQADNAVFIKLSTGETIAESVANVASMEYTSNATKLSVTVGGTAYDIPAEYIDSIYFDELPTTVTVTYSGTTASVINPFYFNGMASSISGGYVTLTNTNTDTERTVSLSGETTDGAFTYNGSYKTTIALNGVSITSTKGAAVDIECGKRIALNIIKGTENTLVDAANGSQKATLYCKGHLEVDKAGTLTVTGNTAHAISAKEYIQFKNSKGTINILGAAKDGIHCKQYFLAGGYTFNISKVGDDGIQAEKDGEDNEEGYDDGSLMIRGGTFSIQVDSTSTAALKADSTCIINNNNSDPSFTITTTGNACKGISADGNVNISAGTFTFTQTGSYTYDGTDKSYVTAIKSDYDINITGGNITINNTAEGGKGISADGNVNISGSATVIDITANGGGGAAKNTGSSSSSTEVTKSYKVYVALPTTGASSSWGGGPGGMGQSNYWTTLYLYKSDGTLVQQLTSTVSKTSGSTTKTFYYYDFKASDSDTYYFTSANYTSRGMGGSATYAIKSSTFSGPTSGEDYYYEISNSYSTSGTTRTFSLSNVTSTWSGSSESAEDSGDAYNASGIKADGNVYISDGTITVKNSGSMSKSIKSKATVTIDGGTLTLTPSGAMQVINSDASYSTGIKAVDFIQNNGSITITATGAAGRGISATNVTTNSGTLKITNSGAGQSGTNDSYTAKGIKGDTSIALNGGTINVSMSGTGGKGIKSSGTYTQGLSSGTGPTLTVATTGSSYGSSSSSTGGWGGMGGGMQESSGSSAKAIKIQGTAILYGGTTVITTSTNGAEGLESKTSINIAGGNHYIKCYDDCINSSGQITFSGGNTVCYGYGNDAVDSNYGKSGAITIAGGNVFAYSTKGAPEEGLDCDNNSYIVVKGGIAVSAGAAQGGGGSSSSSSIGSSTQGYYIGSSPSSYGTSYYYTLCNTSGTPICTYKFEASCSNSLSLLTATDLGKGSVTVKYGTSKPTAYDYCVSNASGTGVFYINPTVTTSGTTTTVTAK